MFLLFIGDAYTQIEIPFVFAKELWSPYCFFLGPDSTRSPFFREWLASEDPLPALLLAKLSLRIQCTRILVGRVRDIVVAAIFDVMTVEDWGEQK